MQVLDFASRRLEQLLLDRGYQIEAVRAVMQESNRDPARVQAAVQQLQVSPCSAGSAERKAKRHSMRPEAEHTLPAHGPPAAEQSMRGCSAQHKVRG